jgi:hypothetical protein
MHQIRTEVERLLLHLGSTRGAIWYADTDYMFLPLSSVRRQSRSQAECRSNRSSLHPCKHSGGSIRATGIQTAFSFERNPIRSQKYR